MTDAQRPISTVAIREALEEEGGEIAWGGKEEEGGEDGGRRRSWRREEEIKGERMKGRAYGKRKEQRKKEIKEERREEGGEEGGDEERLLVTCSAGLSQLKLLSSFTPGLVYKEEHGAASPRPRSVSQSTPPTTPPSPRPPSPRLCVPRQSPGLASGRL